MKDKAALGKDRQELHCLALNPAALGPAYQESNDRQITRAESPHGANIFNPRSFGDNADESINNITLEFTRIVIAIGVFAVGVELPKKYMYRHWKSLFFLLVPVMTWGWFVSAALIYALIPNLSFLSSLAIAACLTPTDPILAAAIIGGKYADKHVPAHLRHLLAAESASNDGAAYPFLYFALALILNRTTGEAMKDWFLITWLYQIFLSIAWGCMLGYGFRHLMKFCERKDLIDRPSYVAQYVSLALLTVGTTTLLGSDDLLASFVCGTAFAWDGFFNKQTEAAVFSSVIDLLLNTAAFLFVGAWMPFDSFSDEALSLSVQRLICISVLVLLLRRLPVIIGLFKWIPDIKNFREALFSAIYTSTIAIEMLPRPQIPPANQAERLAATIQPVVAFMVLCSILIHGLSIPFFSLGRRVTTVTRTWSRQPSLPDWALHTRRVERAEDVVINRDPASVMERGEVDEGEKDGVKKNPSETVDQDDEKREFAGQRKDSTDATTMVVTEPEEGKVDIAPDGAEEVLEWKEGPHRIIERRAESGEEVEVEVQHNAYGPTKVERVTRAFRGRHSQPHEKDFVTDAPESVQGVPSLRRGRLGFRSEFAGGDTARKGTSILNEIRPRSRRQEEAHPPPAPLSPLPHTPPPFDKAPTSTESSSARIASSSTPAPDVSTSPIPNTALPDGRRGRASRAPTSASVPSTYASRRQPRHMRVVSLRESETGSREVSPARSVRWADAGASTSPRLHAGRSLHLAGQPRPSPGPPTPAELVGNDSG
ncbi:Sodium/hydrogen exchanger family-domain-containing protein [Lactifluus volemus]|nr:Sodium/hydrogen exchanger family-domain-containing protein [Lactifluus volemus]